MIIHAIRLTNFGLYAGVQEILPVCGQHGKGTITLVGGLNGRGKTSLLEAVLLNLYGKRSPMVPVRSGGYAGYLESLIHRGVSRSEGSAVELEIEVRVEGDPTFLRIRRSWKATNIRVSDHLEVWRDELEDVYLASNWDTYVEELVPSGLSGLFFFDGEKISALAEEEETPEALRQAIRSMLGLDLVDRAVADLNLIIKRKQTQLGKVKGLEEVSELEKELGTLEAKKLALFQDVAQLNLQIDRTREELRLKEQGYLEVGGSAAINRDSLQNEKAQLESHLNHLRGKMSTLASGPLPLLLVLPLLSKVQAAVKDADKAEQARLLLPMLEERDRRLLDLLVGRGTPKSILSELRIALDAARSDLEQDSRAEVTISLSAVGKGQLTSLLSSGGSWHICQEVEGTVREFEVTEAKLQLVEQHLLYRVEEQSVSAALRELSRVAKHLVELEHQAERAKRELDAIRGSIVAVDRKRQAALEKMLEKVNEVDGAKRTITLATRSQATLQIFGEKVTERKIADLAVAVTEAFRELTHKTELVREIRIHPTKLQIMLLDNNNQEIPKSRLSSGEKQMLAVAILWGLARASRRDLPVIIDTPLGRLDSSHRLNFVQGYLPHASHQVIVLSTDTEIVGNYLVCLQQAIGKRYLLRYMEDQRLTVVEENSYFVGAEVEA